MSDMASLYAQFQQAVMDADASAIAPRFTPHPRLSAQQQLAIYADGYRIRLTEAIITDYPALAAYLGAAAMQHTALTYALAHPSTSYNLDRYSHPFADWFATQSDNVFASEIARLEQAVAEIFMAPESVPLTAQGFAQANPDDFAKARLPLRKAGRLLAFTYPAESWLSQQRTGQETPPRPEATPQWLYVYRHNHEVRRVLLEEAAYRLLTELASGKCVGDALDAVTYDNPKHEAVLATHLQAWFAHWLAEGFFAGD
jgi:hypothetical protein